MPAIRNCLFAIALLSVGANASAQDIVLAPPSQVDFAGFLALSAELEQTRNAHLLGWEAFAAKAREEGAIILDTRSAAAFASGHIEGAINLPFSDFTQSSLLQVLGPDQQRPILIYCNNNFADNVAPVLSKKVELALNIPTFINLHGYGYRNVWELADLMSINDPQVGWSAAHKGEAPS